MFSNCFHYAICLVSFSSNSLINCTAHRWCKTQRLFIMVWIFQSNTGNINMGITLQVLRLSPCVTDKISLVSLDPLILCTEIKNEMRYPNKMANLYTQLFPFFLFLVSSLIFNFLKGMVWDRFDFKIFIFPFFWNRKRTNLFFFCSTWSTISSETIFSFFVEKSSKRA